MFNGGNALQTRDIYAYIAPYASTNAMPADSAWGTAPGGTYRDIGGTDGGLGFNIATTFEDVRFDQSVDAVGVIATGREIHLTAQMAEFTLQNLKDATSQGTITTTPATSGVRGHSDYAMDNTIGVNYLTVLFDAKAGLGDGESYRFALWRAQARAGVTGTISAASKLVLPFDAQGFPDPNNANRVLTIRDVIAALP
jgi:hypothetical protein